MPQGVDEEQSLLRQLAGTDQLDTLSRHLAGRKILLLGAGDLARKKKHWLHLVKRLGLEVYLADSRQNPIALDTLGPYIKEFLTTSDPLAEEKLLDIGRRDPFYIVDISTWPDSHLALALRFQDSAEWIVDTKPVDTHLDFLRTIHNYSLDNNPLFRSLLDKILVHDHYGGRWVLREAERFMPQWHAQNGFVTEVQVFVLEKKSVNQEIERIDAIKDGMCLDLMPHAFRILESLMPVGQTWALDGLNYKRKQISLSLSGGARDQNIGCLIEGQVETFAAASFIGHDVVDIAGRHQGKYPFKALVLVGKGVVSNDGDENDTKGAILTFQTGRRLIIDLESQRMQTPDGAVVVPPTTLLHRGINWPLIELLKHAASPRPLHPETNAFFQPLLDAYRGMVLIDQSRHLPWLGNAYREGAGCVELINRIPRDYWGDVSWQFRTFPQIHIGHPPNPEILIP